MNAEIERFYDMNRFYTRARDQLMDVLTDADLAYRPSAKNPTLGGLCQQIGETEYAYVQSFKTFSVDFSYRNNDPALATSVANLKAWYERLDQELEGVLKAITDEDVQNRQVDRGDNFKLPPHIHLDIYREALLIFYGKATVYLKEMGKPLPELWQAWFV